MLIKTLSVRPSKHVPIISPNYIRVYHLLLHPPFSWLDRKKKYFWQKSESSKKVKLVFDRPTWPESKEPMLCYCKQLTDYRIQLWMQDKDGDSVENLVSLVSNPRLFPSSHSWQKTTNKYPYLLWVCNPAKVRQQIIHFIVIKRSKPPTV